MLPLVLMFAALLAARFLVDGSTRSPVTTPAVNCIKVRATAPTMSPHPPSPFGWGPPSLPIGKVLAAAGHWLRWRAPGCRPWTTPMCRRVSLSARRRTSVAGHSQSTVAGELMLLLLFLPSWRPLGTAPARAALVTTPPLLLTPPSSSLPLHLAPRQGLFYLGMSVYEWRLMRAGGFVPLWFWVGGQIDTAGVEFLRQTPHPELDALYQAQVCWSAPHHERPPTRFVLTQCMHTSSSSRLGTICTRCSLLRATVPSRRCGRTTL